MTLRYSRPEYNGTVVCLIALDAVDYARGTRDRVPTGLPDVEKFLDLPGTNDVLVSHNFARRHDVMFADFFQPLEVAVPADVAGVRVDRQFEFAFPFGEQLVRQADLVLFDEALADLAPLGQ